MPNARRSEYPFVKLWVACCRLTAADSPLSAIWPQVICSLRLEEIPQALQQRQLEKRTADSL